MAGRLLLFVVALRLTRPLQVSAESAPLKCSLSYTPCKDGSDCVRYSHVCDGEADCFDGSDEEDCAERCNADQFQCAHGKKCIELTQVCDGVAQCQDRSDEVECTTRSEDCVHQCADKSRCLPETFVCDGEKDCPDGSDEARCGGDAGADEEKHTTTAPVSLTTVFKPVKCSLGSTPCRDERECIPYSHRCDGEADCKDGSDEDQCPSTCATDQFLCAHGKKCIEQKQVCDGVAQCQDRSDEAECTTLSEGCAHQCADMSRCLPETFLCDGEKDCPDGSDEANCADENCSTSEFQCTSGQCVAQSVRCDGHPDCRDRSDEEDCTQPANCTSKHRCLYSQECLLAEWLCDGDLDCKDATDEKDCPAAQKACGEFQWSCVSKTQCVPKVWKCDGMKDCKDGSDEMGCGGATCPPHQFQCSSQECLDTALVCNGITNCADGSDEGGTCSTKCTGEVSGRCSQFCYSTPQGTKCGCSAGFRLLEDAVTCFDIDECKENPGVCSHICTNSPGSYSCQCNTGYVTEADGHHCKITGEPILLSSVQTELFLLGLRSGSLDVLPSSAEKAILSVDYDWKEQKVFWVGVDSEIIRWSSLNQKTKGTLIKGVRSDSIAVDWVGRNLYWIDGVRSRIIAIRLDTAMTSTLDYSVILDEDLEQPRSLALVPEKGLMFWTEIGNEAKIERAGMDGSMRRAVVNTSLGWPGGVAVDILSNRVYWTDERLKAIGSATFDGEDIRILQMLEISNPFSLAVFNDLLYFSDSKRRSVQAIHKMTGKNRQVLIKRPRQPFGIKIIHPLLQKVIESPCEKLHCSHLCVLAPGPKAVCKCPSKLLLAEDGLTCAHPVNTAFLLLLSPSTVTQIYLQALHTAVGLKGWPEHQALQLPNLNEADLMDCSLRDQTLLLTDGGTASLGLFKLKETGLVPRGQLIKLLGDTITAMALDWITSNVYWSSTKQPRLQVTSASGAYTAVLVQGNMGVLEAIAVHPPSGRVCFLNLGSQAGSTVALVECTLMDGTDRKTVQSDAVQPTSLVFSNSGEKIYWADTSSGMISSVHVDGSGYQEFQAGSGLAALALSDNMLIWVTISDTTKVWCRDELQKNKLWFEVSTGVVSLKAYTKSSQAGSNQCSVNNGNCQHLCLATPGDRTCKCAHDHVSVNATHCAPGHHCPEGSRPCLDGHTCYPVENFCDGQLDCPDNSDENCVHLKERSGAKPTAVPRAPNLLTTPEVVEPSATLNISTHPMLLDAQHCGLSHCNGHGDCVEGSGSISCVCSAGFSGPSCLDDAEDFLQGPIIYGAAGVAAGVVIIAVLATVLKKKSANTSATPAAKETSLTNLEKIQSSQPAPSEAHVEEVVSSVD